MPTSNQMEIKLKKSNLKTIIGCKLLHDTFVEEVLVINYSYKKNKGVNFTSLLIDKFLTYSFGLEVKDINVYSLVSKDKLHSVTYGTLDMLDVLLLNELEDITFKDILFKCEDKDNYIFEVSY